MYINKDNYCSCIKIKLNVKLTSSVNSTTGVVTLAGDDEAIDIGSVSIGGVDEIGVNADV